MWSIFNKSEKEPAKLFFTTDIHCHVLPGIDDGSPDVATSLELIERMHGFGIGRIIASPHVSATFENAPAALDEALKSVNSALAADSTVHIRSIERSAEYRLDDVFRSQFDNGQLTPLPRNYILVENSFVQEPWDMDKALFDLRVAGYFPILAHPERYLYYHGKRDRYVDLYNKGVLFQINLLSLSGFYGKAEQQIAEWLLSKDMVGFIGTDLHNHRHADAIEEFLSSRHYRNLSGKIRVRNDNAF